MYHGAGAVSLERRIERGEVENIALDSGPQRTKSAWPLDKSSNATGSNPCAASVLQVWLPINPAPPVMRTVSIANCAFRVR
jgi:hypothetical protein